MRAIGLMSGTSLDGVDVACLESDGETIAALGPARTFPYSEDDRALLRAATDDAAGLTDRRARPGMLAEAERLVTARHAEAVETFVQETSSSPVDLIGFHGQTVLHDPQRGLTVQIGDGHALAARLGAAVAWDFRADDVAAGGEGAPLAPVFHRALAKLAGVEAPVAFLNIGGVANITYVGDDEELTAFDSGPGNGLLDDWMLLRRGAAFDAGGRLAAAGTACEGVVEEFLRHPYFDRPPPKSLDRRAFSPSLARLSDADGAATLVHLTAASVAAALRHLPTPPRAWYVAGGGRRNGAMMRALAQRLGETEVRPIEALGFDGDAVEAQAFAYLAVRSAMRLPISFPRTTGAPQPISGGRLSRPGALG
jgi:anhydro-N-acetylmuramic acid kinase